MKEYTYNTGHKVFQFTWLPSKTVEETIFLTTGKSKDIHEMIGKFLTNLLREKKGIKDPEKILNDCTYQRPPEVDKMKRGGTQRSYSTPAAGGVKKIKKNRPPDAAGSGAGVGSASMKTPKKGETVNSTSSPTPPSSQSDSIRPARSMPSGVVPSSSPSPKKTKKKMPSEDSSDEESSEEEKETSTPSRKIVAVSAPTTAAKSSSSKRTKNPANNDDGDNSDSDSDQSSSDGESATRRISRSQQATPASRRQQRRPKQRSQPQSPSQLQPEELQKTPSSKKRGAVDDIQAMRKSPLSKSAPQVQPPAKTPSSSSKRKPKNQD